MSGILARAFERKMATDFTDFEKLAWRTVAGVTVSEETALKFSAVWACVRVISEDVATLPLFMYRRLERGKERALDHQLHRVLHDQPNPEMTALQFRETLTAHVLTWGNAYGYIVRDGTGRVQELWPLLPDRTRAMREDRTRELFYETELPSGERRRLPPKDVLHLAGLGFDGLVGYSPIAMHRQAIGLGLAAEEFGARFFGQGTHLGGIVEVPDVLGDPAYARLKTSVAEGYQGLGRSHLLMILEQGAKFNKMTIPPDEAQFVESRKLQVTEIARIFRVPPHKIMDLERATFSNIEHSAIEYVVSTLRPWLVRWEQAIRMKLLAEDERNEFFAEHVVEGLLRGDTVSRYQSYNEGIQGGFLKRSEARERENLPFVEGTDVLLEPLNMVEVGSRADGEGNGKVEGKSLYVLVPAVRAAGAGGQA